MRKLLLATAATFGLAGLATNANAMEVNFGVQGGYGWSESDVLIPAYSADEISVDGDGWILGGFAGADWDVAPGWQIGFEADANWTDGEGDEFSGGPPTELYVVEQNWNASLRARVSVDVSPNTDLFGSLGWAWTDIDTSYANPSFPSDSATLQGWTAGFGLEHSFGNWFGRVEYRYTAYDDEDFFHGGPSTADLTTNALLFGAGWTM